MRIFSFIPAFAVLATALTGAALPVEPGQDNCGYEVGCELAQSAAKRDFFEYPTHTARGLTNAALLRRGLPLNKPIMRRGASNLLSILPPILRNYQLFQALPSVALRLTLLRCPSQSLNLSPSLNLGRSVAVELLGSGASPTARLAMSPGPRQLRPSITMTLTPPMRS